MGRLLNRPSWEDFYYKPTIHRCDCGAFLQRAVGTSFLACPECAEVRWLV